MLPCGRQSQSKLRLICISRNTTCYTIFVTHEAKDLQPCSLTLVSRVQMFPIHPWMWEVTFLVDKPTAHGLGGHCIMSLFSGSIEVTAR